MLAGKDAPSLLQLPPQATLLETQIRHRSTEIQVHFGDGLQTAAASWNTFQEELKKLSPRSRQIIARGSTHHAQVLRIESVIPEV
jgi:hypothetical protein